MHKVLSNAGLFEILPFSGTKYCLSLSEKQGTTSSETVLCTPLRANHFVLTLLRSRMLSKRRNAQWTLGMGWFSDSRKA